MRRYGGSYSGLGKEASGRDGALETLGLKVQSPKDKDGRCKLVHIVQQQFAVVVVNADGPERVTSIASTGHQAREKTYSIER